MHQRWILVLLFAVGSAGCCRESCGPTGTAPSEPAPCGCDIDRTQFIAWLAEDDPPAGTWPMFGGTPQRNMVNTVDKNIPTEWSVEEGKQKNIKWAADVGSRCYGGPVIADGKVFVGTNNANPRDPLIKASKAVLMAVNE